MPAPITNLKQQLQKQIQDKTKVITSQERATKHSSYIGEPNLDKDTLHELALESLQKLIVKDIRFQPYELTLFSDAVKTLDRKLLTAKENEFFDSSIAGLLRLISKYFFDEPASLVLEWLVRKFSIHLHNVNQVFEAIIPYHSTPQFLRMLLILNLNGEDLWQFMKKVKKARVSPNRAFFVQECLKHPALLQFFINMTTKSIESGIENITLWSFFAAILLEYISSVVVVTDNMIRHISPVLFEFLKTERYPDIQVVACMSFALMLRRVPVTANVTESVLSAMNSALPSHGVDADILAAMEAISGSEEEADANMIESGQINAPTPIAVSSAAVEILPYADLSKAILAYLPEKAIQLESSVARMDYAGLLSQIPRPLEAVSWLDKNLVHPAYCDLIYELYRLASRPGADPTALMNLLDAHIVHYDDIAPFLLSFFLREPLEVAHQSNNQVKALEILFKYLSSQKKGRPLDYQILLPSLVITLNHPDMLVRLAAELVINEVAKSYRVINVNCGTKKSNIAFAGTFYGSQSEHLRYLETRQAAKLVEHIANLLPTWVKDGSTINAQFADVLLEVADGIRETRDQLITFFLTHVLAFPGDTARTSLLALLEPIDTPVKLRTVFPLLRSALNAKSISLARAILKCYSASTVASLSLSKIRKYLAGFYLCLDYAETQQLALQICTGSSWFLSLRDALLQQELFSKLIDLAIATPSQGGSSIRRALASLPVSTSIVKEDIHTVVGLLSTNDEQLSKKKRVDESSEENNAVERLVLLLEMLPQWSDMASSLIEVLFEALALTIEQSGSSLLSADYLRQLILTGILLGVPNTTRWESIRTDTIVQTMRVSDNPQIHQICLLILAALAKNAPEHTLHNIMSVFTFMTNNLLRADDSYSFHVADQLLEAVVPSVMKHSTAESLTDIIQLFVDVIPHIPAHRRVPLFVVLLNTMSADAYLGLVLSLVMKTHHMSEKLHVASDVLPVFCVELSREFDVLVVLKATVELLVNNTDSKKDALQYVFSILHDKAFSDKIKFEFDPSLMSYADIQEQYLELVRILSSQSDESAESSLLVLSQAVPLASYMEMVSVLLPSISGKIKLRVVSSLRAALTNRSDEELQKNAVSVNQVIVALEQSVLVKKKVTSILPTALETIEAASKKLAKSFPEVYASLLSNIVDTYLVRWDAVSNVLAAGFRLLGILCCELGPRIIPSLPRLIPQAVKLAANRTHSDTPIVHQFVIILIDTIIRQLPKFVTPSIPNILDYLSFKHSGSVYRTLGKHVEAVTLLRVITNRALVNTTDASVAIHVMDEITSHLSLEELTTQCQFMTQVYLRVLDVTELSQSQKPIDSFVRFILRLNETLFKPLFIRIRYWALSSNTPIARKSIFWKLVVSLLDRLQAIFAPYVIQILDEISESFEEFRKVKDFSTSWSDLWSVIRKFLAYYTDGALSSHINTLVPLMVDQITYIQGEEYLAKMIENVVPTLGQLAISLKNQPLLRTLHHQVLMITRLDDARIRLVAVCCLNEMWVLAGESLHAHLSEAAPFLAELVEDNDERVEQATKQWLQELQTLLGPDERILD